MRKDIILRVNKIGRVGQVITKIGKVMSIIAFVVCACAVVVSTVYLRNAVTMEMSHQAVLDIDLNELNIEAIPLPTSITGSIGIKGIDYKVVDFEHNGSEFKVYADAGTNKVRFSNMLWIVVPAMLWIVSDYILLSFAEKLCRVFRDCETPFSEEVIKAMKKVAFSIIPTVFLWSITQSAADSIMTGNVNIMIKIDLMTIMSIILVFMLVSIFKYGTMLQIESDETL